MASLLIDQDNNVGRPVGFFAWQVAAGRRLESIVTATGQRLEVRKLFRRGTYQWLAETSDGRRYVELDGGPGGKWIVTRKAPKRERRRVAA